MEANFCKKQAIILSPPLLWKKKRKIIIWSVQIFLRKIHCFPKLQDYLWNCRISTKENTFVAIWNNQFISFVGLRKVYPYFHTFTSYVKGRWLGRTVWDVFTKEFHVSTEENLVRIHFFFFFYLLHYFLCLIFSFFFLFCIL